MYCCTRAVAVFLPSCTTFKEPHCNLQKLQFPLACERRGRVVRRASSTTSRAPSRISEVKSRERLNPGFSTEMGVSPSRGSQGASSSPPSRSRSDVPEERATPPWILHGRGYVFPFLLSKEITSSHSTYVEDPNELVEFVGGVGGFVLSDYWDSPVGPYKELVFIPGRYQYHDGALKKAHGISRIWVDNEKSVRDARANWGIPKEFGEFEWRESSSSQAGRVTVRHPSKNGRRGDVIFDAAINDSYSPVSVPIRTKVPLLPVDFLNLVPLIQLPLDGWDRNDTPHLLKTTLSLTGWLKPAAMAEKPRVDASLLPSMGALYGLSIPSFELQFKEPLKLLSKAGTTALPHLQKGS
ncbi:hypothetical protein M758_3G266600 [Ceratodon purpureus]|uniref:Uncharacterized protein n=1 Tax=Ceratodon purpureus TaxID=3225 RepID=A0A8T0IQ75_CERPU|nr:hypothetical protein KC19_3G266200 [Ceratodon purpureus]KAG0624675.1 hypothetical protein M758_3G266600 [Ceratodon purpureus]